MPQSSSSEIRLHVAGMDCADEAALIRHALARPGVESLNFDLVGRRVDVAALSIDGERGGRAAHEGVQVDICSGRVGSHFFHAGIGCVRIHHGSHFVAGNVAAGSTVVSDGWSGYATLTDVKHDPRVIGDAPAHLVLPWIHRVFANAKRWALGVYHGLRSAHLQAYLDEFAFRFNRRRTPQAAFGRLLGLAVTTGPHPYNALIASGPKG